MEKLKTYLYLTFALISVFLIGAYADSVLYGTREIEPYQWVLTSFFGIIFLMIFFQKYRK